MKLQLIAAAVGSALAFGALAQYASESGGGATSGNSGSNVPALSSGCESLTGEARAKCLRDEASNQNSTPSQVPASTAGSSSTESTPGDSAASGSSGNSESAPSDATPASQSD